MSGSNKMYLIGDINEDSFKEFSEQLLEVENSGDFNIPLELEINSAGGNAIDALAFCSRIRSSKQIIHATVYGLVGSAAVLVFAACDKRIMTQESWMMVHEDEENIRIANTSKYEKHAKHMRRLEDQWCSLLEHFTKTDKEIWAKLHKEDTYLTPAECVKLGIAEEII